jgi:DNA-binding Lrp family transcriptional regulator
MVKNLKEVSMPKAYVLISCDPGYENSIINNLKSIETVKDAHETFGSHDIIVKMESDREDKLNEAITKRIRRLSKIRATLTLMVDGKKDLFGKKLRPDEKETLDKHASQAYVTIECKRAKENEVLQELSAIPEVIEGDVVMGSFDLICKVAAPTYNDISDVVIKKIRRINSVTSTSTLNVMP